MNSKIIFDYKIKETGHTLSLILDPSCEIDPFCIMLFTKTGKQITDLNHFNYSIEHTTKPENYLECGDPHIISPNDIMDGSLSLMHNNKRATLKLIEIKYEKVSLENYPRTHTVSQKVFKNGKQKQPTVLSSHYL